MSFALAGLLVPGLSIADPDVVTKSWPAYWSMLDAIVR
jgi:3-phosphoshikimate 1-carboxyvinyltransferase